MSLSSIEESLVLAAFFRGGDIHSRKRTSNTDQILTLSLFYMGNITAEDCAARFAHRSYVQKLYVDKMWTGSDYGQLTEEIDSRYHVLIAMIQKHPELIEASGNLTLPQHPTFTSCRLTDAGCELALSIADHFPAKPDFPNWPDKRTMPTDT